MHESSKYSTCMKCAYYTKVEEYHEVRRCHKSMTQTWSADDSQRCVAFMKCRTCTEICGHHEVFCIHRSRDQTWSEGRT